METIKKKALPKVFRFSMLINILPYYDYLPRWMWLLVSLNSQTYTIWKENRQAFYRCNSDYKPTKKLTDLNTFRDIIENKCEYFKSFHINEKVLRLFLRNYLPKQDNSVISLIFKSWNSFAKYTLSLFNKDKASEYIPASNWKHFTYEEAFTWSTNNVNRFMLQINEGI